MTNHKELTTEDRAAILAQYIGAECQYYIGFGEYMTGKFIGIKPCIGYVEPSKDIETAVLLEYDGKPGIILSLYDLADITDEDKIEVAKICYYPHEVKMFERTGGLEKMAQKGMDIIHEYVGDDYCFCHKNQLILFDFLRSRSYALPYKGINLFESGIAIRKTR